MDTKCDKHTDDIEIFHNKIVSACLSAVKVLPRTGNTPRTDCVNDRKRRIPGWTDECALLRQKAIMWHNLWRDSGRPRHGSVADIRRLSRARYHRAVRAVMHNEAMIRSQKMGVFRPMKKPSIRRDQKSMREYPVQ